MTVGVDSMGTMFAHRAGTDESLPPVLVGSHLDTQPTGGRFDGVLGVLGGLEVVRTLNDLGIKTRYPIEVVNWTNEEGARFAPAMMASGVFAGVLTQGLCLWPHRREGPRLRRRARAHRLQGPAARRSEEAPRLFRAAYRAGPDPRGRGYRHRRRHPRTGPVVAPGDPDRQGRAYRLDADAAPPQCRPRHGADHRAGPDRRHGPPAGRGRRHRPVRLLSELAQRSSPARSSSPSTSARRNRRSSTP